MKKFGKVVGLGAGLLLSAGLLLGGAVGASAAPGPAGGSAPAGAVAVASGPLSAGIMPGELGGLGEDDGGGGGGIPVPTPEKVSPMNQNGGGGIPGMDVKVEESDKGSITKYMEGYDPISDDNMKNASMWASPLVGIIGTLTGIALLLAWIWVAFQTSLDLLYIAIPPLRTLMFDGGNNGTGQGMMGAGGAMGSSQTGKKRQWISDEAASAAASLGGSAQSQGQQMGGGMGGFGGGMGMGAGMSGGQVQAQSKKSVIFTYFKSRAVFLVLFGLATVVLLSSFFMDAGLNLGEWLMKAIEGFNIPMIGG